MTTPRKVWTSYKRADAALLERPWDTIVVGSGVGGLATAALLARHGGQRVLVLERHYTAGGFTHVFHRPGFEWDVGVHYVGGMARGGFLDRLFGQLTDGSLEWADMGDVYDRAIIGGEVFDFPRGRKALRDALRARFPGEHAAIDAYFDAVRAVQRASPLFFAEKLAPRWLASLLGGLMRRRLLGWSDRTTAEVLDGLTSNALLKAVLTTQLGDYGLPPKQSSFAIHAMVASHYFHGGYYPVGGSARIAESIEPVITAAGGAVWVAAEVERLEVEGGRVVGVRMAADGRVLRAARVVSDAGAALTLGHLVPEAHRPALGVQARLGAVRPSAAHLSLYLGLDRTAAALDLPKHNLWIYPSVDHDTSLAERPYDPSTPLPVAYVSFPSAKDPDFERRHPGKATIEVVTVAPWSWFERWQETDWHKRGPEYEAFKAQLTAQMLAVLDAHVPQARAHIVHSELSTPLSTRHFAGYTHGEIYGVDHTPARFRQRWLKPATALPGLWLTGQDVATCGVAGALIGGVLCASGILKRNLLTGLRVR
jgi:all-trans-retinol 13,14-reductase